MISRPIVENQGFLEKKVRFFLASSSGHLGGPGDSQSMGNRLLSNAGDIFEINLPDRVELVTELGHFVGGLPPNPAEAGMSSISAFRCIFNVFSMDFLNICPTWDDIPVSAGFEGRPPTKWPSSATNSTLSGKFIPGISPAQLRSRFPIDWESLGPPSCPLEDIRKKYCLFSRNPCFSTIGLEII